MNFFEKQLRKAEQYLRPECFDVCTILSGRTMELVLRELLHKYLQEATPPQRSAVKNEILSLKKQSPDSLTAGEMAIIFERCNILRGFATVRKINMEDQRLPDFKTMVKIRNKAIHEKVNDAVLEKADAHVMYGSVLRLLSITALLLSDSTEKETIAAAQQEMTPRRQAPDGVPVAAHPMTRSDALTLYRNRASGKYFVFLGKEEEGKILLVIPTGQIKALDRKLFESEVEIEEEKAISDGLILEEQTKRYHEYAVDEVAQQNRRGETARRITRRILVGKLSDDDTRDQAEGAFTYDVHGAKASLVCKLGAYVILKGSTAVREEKASIPDNAQKTRRDLLRKGILVPDQITTRLKFTQDVSFDSPSAASGVVSASSTNGWICFKLSNGKTLKQMMRRERN